MPSTRTTSWKPLLVAIPLALSSWASAGEQTSDAPAPRMELTRCMAHVERASQAALMRKSWAEDAAKAMRCHPQRYPHLSASQRERLATVYDLFQLQTEAPSAAVHTELLLEVQRFLQGLR